MSAESNVGARIFLIGKDGVLAGLKEIQGATARLNAEIAAGARSSKIATAGYDEQMAGLARLGTAMDVYQGQLARTNAEQDAVARVGKVAFLSAAAAGAAWTYESIKWAQNYQTQLVRLRTQAGMTVSAMNQVGAAAMKNAALLGTTPAAYLQAAYHPASTGFSARDTISITNYAAREAAISGAPLEDTTNSLTGVMKAYDLHSDQTGKTIARLNAIVGAGNMRFADLNSALGSGVASTAKTFGVGLTSLGGALAYLTDRGVPAGQAGTRLRMGISLIGAPSQQAQKFLTDAGLSKTEAKDRTSSMAQTLIAAGLTTNQLSGALRDNKGAGGIYNALKLLHDHLTASGMSQELQAAFISRSFGGGRMGTTIESLYNNLPGLAQKSSQIDKGGTTKKFMQDWALTTQTLTFRLHALGGELETIGTQFGQKVLPWVSKGVGGFTDLLKILDQNKGLVIALGSAITAILVPAIGVYLFRALLSSGGAIRSVIGGYKQLILGQSAEQAALVRTDAALATTTGATVRLAAADGELTGASLVAGKGGVAGAGRGLLGKAGTVGMGLYGGYLASSLIQGNNGSALNPNHSTGANVRSLLGDVAGGGIAGATIGSAVPVIGTAIGGLLGAVGGGAYGERHQISSVFKSGWDDLFGHGSSSKSTTSSNRLVIQNHVTVKVDGKALMSAVTKQTKVAAART